MDERCFLFVRFSRHYEVHWREYSLFAALHDSVGAFAQRAVHFDGPLRRQTDEFHADEQGVRAPAAGRRRLEVGQRPARHQQRVPGHGRLGGQVCLLHDLEADREKRLHHLADGADVRQAVSLLQANPRRFDYRVKTDQICIGLAK